ncbi:MAG: cysteine hydrolase family protein [Lapillicoccus sp.]
MDTLAENAALIVIDVQQGFDSASFWGPTTNLECEDNVAALLTAWTANARPIVVVRHNSANPNSPLHPTNPGNALKAVAADAPADLAVVKSVNSAFLGDPDLHGWLQEREIRQLVVCGLQTNMCVETTARMGGNLGYDVFVPLDATRTFDLVGPTLLDATVLQATAADLMRATAINLHGGGFADVVTTDEVLHASR